MWKRRILRRSWPMIKKPYSTPKLMVGTVRKSIAAMASRWFPRKVSQRRGRGFAALVAANAWLGYLEAQLEQLAVDTRCSPGRILRRHRKDHLPHRLAHCPTATDRPGSRDPFPVPAKASAMPLHHGSWRDQNEGPFPSRPKLSQKNPKQLVHWR